ncbi:hypothetical protein, partial [Salsuginibacillus kocurii]|uniref:hypothetical protein n=1 Tax=Salsuginibacillus kocurii TaxID=427078 RepID=UPI00058F6A12
MKWKTYVGVGSATLLITMQTMSSSTVAYFTDYTSTSDFLISADYELETGKCIVRFHVENKTSFDINDLLIEAGQEIHNKNNYIVDPIEKGNIQIPANETATADLEVDHREGIHCNIQWVYYQLQALEGHFELSDRVRVHNPPGLVDIEDDLVTDVELSISEVPGFMMEEAEAEEEVEAEEEAEEGEEAE